MRCTTRESSLTIVTCFKYLVEHSLISWRKLFLFVTLIKWIESCYFVEMTVFDVVFSIWRGKRESGKFKSFSGDRKVEKNNNNRRPLKTKEKKFKQFVLKQLIFNVTISVCRNAWFKNHSSLLHTDFDFTPYNNMKLQNLWKFKPPGLVAKRRVSQSSFQSLYYTQSQR